MKLLGFCVLIVMMLSVFAGCATSGAGTTVSATGVTTEPESNPPVDPTVYNVFEDCRRGIQPSRRGHLEKSYRKQ